MAKRKNNLSRTPLEMYSLVVRGKLKAFPNNYLDKAKIKVMVRQLVLVSYNYTREELLTKVDHSFLQANFLGGAKKFFDGCDIDMLIYCFPEWDLNPWEFRKVPQGFWKKAENQKEFVLWIAEKEGIELTSKEGYRKITADVIFKYGGSKPLREAGGLYELLNTVACNKYKKWEITRVPAWQEQDIVPAIKWLVEEKLQYTLKQACNIKKEDFTRNNLDGLLQKVGNKSVFAALELAYPGMYYRTGRQGISFRE